MTKRDRLIITSEMNLAATKAYRLWEEKHDSMFASWPGDGSVRELVEMIAESFREKMGEKDEGDRINL